MQVSVESTSTLERRMTVEVPGDQIESAVDEKLRTLAKTARLNGFRPGKVPYKVVKKRFEPQVRSEVLGDVINSSFQEAVQQEELRLAGMPAIEPAAPESANTDENTQDTDTDSTEAVPADDSGFRYIATFEVYPDFEPVFNDQIKVERPVAEITGEDVDRMIESLLNQNTEFAEVERASQDGDQLIIDFEGSIDGELFDGGSAEETPLVLGSGSMIDGFESQLTGVSKDEEKTITVSFPENYGHEPLAGKEAQFAIKVHAVNEPRVPELTEELIRKFGVEDGTVEGLRADIEKNMERELKQRVDAQVKQQVLDGLLDLNQIEVPKALISNEVKLLKERMASQMQGMDPDSLNSLPDDLFSDEAIKRVRLGLVIGEIIRQHEIKADADDVRQHVENMAASYENPQSVVEYYYSNKELMENLEGLVLEDTVTRNVLEKATVSDKVMSFQDLMEKQPEVEAPADENEPAESAQNDSGADNHQAETETT